MQAMVVAPEDQFMPVFTCTRPQDCSISIIRKQSASLDIHEQYRSRLHRLHHHVTPTPEHGDRAKGSGIGEHLLELRRVGNGNHPIGVRGQSKCIAS
jgi:hypothetical protein